MTQTKTKTSTLDVKWTKRARLYDLLNAVRKENATVGDDGKKRPALTSTTVNALLGALLEQATPATLTALAADCGDTKASRFVQSVAAARTAAQTKDVKLPKTDAEWKAVLQQAPPELVARLAAA